MTDKHRRVLNPDNRTVDRNIRDSEISYAGASYTQDFEFPSPVGSDSPRSSSTATDSSDADPAQSTGSSLSKAAKIGISVAAAVVGVLLIGALLAFFILPQRQAHASCKRPAYPMSEFTPSQKDLVHNAAVHGSDRY